MPHFLGLQVAYKLPAVPFPRKEKLPARMDALMARVDYTNARVTFAFVTHATSPEFSS